MKYLSMALLILAIVSSPFLNRESLARPETENDPGAPPVATECCDGQNLISNGDFTNGQPSFTSDYTQAPDPTGTSLIPGEYMVRRPDDELTRAFMICIEWDIKDQAHCNTYDAGGYMLVNGLTNDNGWQTVMDMNQTLDEGTYNFCVDFKNLRNCCFNFHQPQIVIDILVGGVHVVNEGFFLNENTDDPCDWLNKYINFSVGSSSNVSIQIKHNAGFRMDGNDFAIDNISLKRLASITSDELDFELEFEPVNPSHFNLTVEPLETLDEDCTHIWTVCEVDGQGDCINVLWSGSASSYPFTIPMSFPNNGEYKVIYEAECPCALQGSRSLQIGPYGMAAPNTDGSTMAFRYELVDDAYVLHSNSSGALKSSASTLEDQRQSQIKVYPNPSKGSVAFELAQDVQGATTLEIYSMEGKLIYSDTKAFVNSLKTQVSLEGVASGVYNVVVKGSEGTVRTSIVIE